MTALAFSTPLALPLAAPGMRRSATHRLVLALVWVAVVLGAVVFSEPAPVDVLTMGLIVLLPVVGLVTISRRLIAMLALMLMGAAGAFLGTINAMDAGAALTHTGVSLYLYLAAFVFAAFVAKRPQAHARLVLDANLCAGLIAATAGIIGYFDLVPGAHELLTRYGRATSLFKDPNVFGPFLALPLVYALSRLVTQPLRSGGLPMIALPVLGLAVFLSFSRGAWLNLALSVTIYGVLQVVTAENQRTRLKVIGLAIAAFAMAVILVGGSLQIEAVSDLLAERAALTQSYDVGPEGRFGGQEKAALLVLENPFGIGAQQFVPYYHHEEPHNVYLALFLNAGWLGGLAFVALVIATIVHGARHTLRRTAAQPLFLAVYACFVAHAIEGVLIDIDHWRHFYLLLAVVWGLMTAPTFDVGRRCPA